MTPRRKKSRNRISENKWGGRARRETFKDPYLVKSERRIVPGTFCADCGIKCKNELFGKYGKVHLCEDCIIIRVEKSEEILEEIQNK